MSDLTFETLPIDEKRELAIELRPTHTVRELAKLLNVSTKRAWTWTRHLKADLRRESRRGRKSIERCDCAVPIGDHRFDAYCRRTRTCFCCGKRVA